MAVGARVRLVLIDPARDEAMCAAAALPALFGRLVRAVPGYFGLLRYVLALDEPLPPGFDPFGELSEIARRRRVRHLLLTPAPELPTLAAPPDVIGERIARGEHIRVFVSIGPDPAGLPRHGAPPLPEHRYPVFSVGDVGAAEPTDRRLSPRSA